MEACQHGPKPVFVTRCAVFLLDSIVRPVARSPAPRVCTSGCGIGAFDLFQYGRRKDVQTHPPQILRVPPPARLVHVLKALLICMHDSRVYL